MSFSGTIEPLDGVSLSNRGGEVVIYAIAAVLFSIAFSVIRFGLIIQKRLGFDADDALLIACLLFAIACSVVSIFAVYNGLGKHIGTLSGREVPDFFKAVYASRILGALSMACAKSSVGFLYRRLDIYVDWRIKALPPAIALTWTFLSVPAIAFQCRVPSPWIISSSNCPAGVWLSIAVAAFNCFSDAALIIYPIPGLLKLNMTTSTRATVIGLFSSRVLTCVMAVIDGMYTVQTFRSSDTSWDDFVRTITTIVLVNISLITATLSRVHSFLVTISSGQTSVHLPSHIRQSRFASIRSILTARGGLARGPKRAGNGAERVMESQKYVPKYPNVLHTEVWSHPDPWPREAEMANDGSAYSEEIKCGASGNSAPPSDAIRLLTEVEYRVSREHAAQAANGRSFMSPTLRNGDSRRRRKGSHEGYSFHKADYVRGGSVGLGPKNSVGAQEII